MWNSHFGPPNRNSPGSNMQAGLPAKVNNEDMAIPSADAVTRAKNSILILLLERSPNFVSGFIVRSRLPEYDEATILSALSSLVSDRKINSSTGISASVESYYALTGYSDIPIRRYIRVGDTDIPRVTADTPVIYFPENFNEAVERLAEYSAGIEKRFEETFAKQLRDYWTTLVTVFGVFVAILAFVIVGLPKIAIDSSRNPWDVFVINLVQVIPVALVLAAFVLVLRFVIRSR
jgi:hypothetical protein